MDGVLEYYVTSGEICIGKRELLLELLRKDSILRALLGFDGGDLNSFLSKTTLSNQRGDKVLIDFNGRKKKKLTGDPTRLLEELKNRYEISGTLNYQLVYTTFNMTFDLSVNLSNQLPVARRVESVDV